MESRSAKIEGFNHHCADFKIVHGRQIFSNVGINMEVVSRFIFIEY